MDSNIYRKREGYCRVCGIFLSKKRRMENGAKVWGDYYDDDPTICKDCRDAISNQLNKGE